MFRPFVFLIIALCASSATNAQNAFSQCMDVIFRNPAVLPIVGKVALTASQFNDFRYLVNTDKVSTDEERTAIGSWIEERQKCDRLTQVPNRDAMSVFRSLVSATEAAAAELYMGAISYGEFHKKRVLNSDEAKRALRQIEEQEIAKSEAIENARLQAILGMMNRPGYQSAPLTFTPMQLPKTTTSNCAWIGNQLNCTTR